METKVFDLTNHRRLWMWLSENPEKDKEDWVDWGCNGGTVPNVNCECFACEYDDSDECNNCPLEWTKNSDGERKCTSRGLWSQWFNTSNPLERSRLAKVIAELPVKPGIICV